MVVFYGNNPLPLVFIHVFLANPLPLVFIYVFLANTGCRKTKKFGKQVLVKKNCSNKKEYVGMGGVTRKRGVTAYNIAFEPRQNVSYSCDPTHSYVPFFILRIFY